MVQGQWSREERLGGWDEIFFVIITYKFRKLFLRAFYSVY